LHSLAFTLRHRCNDFTVPSKAVGTAKPERQRALWKRVGRVEFGTPLDVDEVADGKRIQLVLSHEGDELGHVQLKWLPVVRPLLPWGTGIRVVRITGHENEHYRPGLNIFFTNLANSIAALERALGTDLGGDGHGGDGASQTPTEAAPIEAKPLSNHGGDGAPNIDGMSGRNGVRDRLRLLSPALPVAKHRADSSAHPDDIVLFREIDGTAKASVEHVIRHSPTGIEWGYAGSGPADLARSILLQFTDEATANRMYQRFKAEVVAAIPIAGGVIRAAEVRAWLAAQDAE
jgi:hypothetical protein